MLHLKCDCSILWDIRRILISGSHSDSVRRAHQELFEWEKMEKICFRTVILISQANTSGRNPTENSRK
jgi:hypothetical protein